MKLISQINPSELSGKTVIVRVDYNVPVIDGKVIDDFRIKSSFETISFLIKAGAKIILISHIENKQKASLDAVAAHINNIHASNPAEYPFAVNFMPDMPARLFVDDAYVSPENAASIKAEIMSLGDSIVLFENLRVVPGEKENDPAFAKILASFADFYINDAFSVSHRAHASVTGLPALLPHAAGFQLEKEISFLKKGLHPTHPFLFVLGGAKFETKLPLIEKFMQSADKVIVGGALFNDIMKAKGLSVGTSLVSDVEVSLSSIINSPKLIIPKDVIVKNTDGQIRTVATDMVGGNESVLDIGPDLIAEVTKFFDECDASGQKPFVLWNGPMGNYEIGFKEQTIALAKLLSDRGIESLLGGGDTTAAIAEIDNVNPSVYISTGGGAMIEFLQNETLPGIDALA